MAFGDIDIPYFHEQGFVRKVCRVTDLWFWTRDTSRETSGDTTEDEYTFIGAPIIQGYPQRGKALKDAMRETFLNYFEEHSHTRVEPYPVIARWRDDIHLTIASIADFQPHVTSGIAPPPANPLTISQPCIRLTDVAAVGRSGRHLTTFEMMAHHCFNRPDDGDVKYWMEECIRFCDDLFVNRLGIDPNEITYVENPWSGGGNAGPAVEVIVGGLELATLVFMNLEERDDGDVEIKGIRYGEMPLQIIDTGYGLERFCWAAAGTPTIYEAIYPETVAWLQQESDFQSSLSQLGDIDMDSLLSELSRLAGILNIDVGTDVESLYNRLSERLEDRGFSISVEQLKTVTEPLASIYAIPDHMHALCNMLGDTLIPSNAKAGYLARMLARRVCRMKDDLGLSMSLSDLGAHHMDVNLDMSGFNQSREGILTILQLEEARYHEMLRKGEAAVNTALAKLAKDASNAPDEILFRLAEERGLQPDMVASIANRLGWENLGIRVGFAADMAERNAQQTKAAAKAKGKQKLVAGDWPSTIRRYYDDTSQTQFEATVLHCAEIESSALNLSSEVQGTPTHAIILDHTLFYPEGGGQLGDSGMLGGATVFDTHIDGDVILHLTDAPLAGTVNGEVSWERRKQLMDHHTSVHIIGGSARALLGPHIWQAGSSKGERYARLDVTHFQRLTRDDLDAIEDHANAIIAANPTVEKMVMERAEADAQFGFELYQGGPPKHSQIRIIRIGEHDVQACGGTHHDQAGEIGEVRIIRSSQVQDGVERLQIVAGETAREHARRQERLLAESAEALGVSVDDLPKTVNRFFEEWKSQQKKIETLEAEIVRLRTSGGGDEAVEKDGIRYIVMEATGELKQMQNMVGELTRDASKPTVAVVGSREGGGKLIVAITEGTAAAESHNAVEILNAISSHIGGGGGGRPTFAQGGGSNADGLDAALDAARVTLDL
ncbi:MAG: alanine--tRNA ligase [Candidatus Thalassarchaeaceae archaeon]|jgi:alanyl-tRNA synthetase|nr:alanine--tRNA ligase [Candidatus Thalassarchaeaceae archaeon]